MRHLRISPSLWGAVAIILALFQATPSSGGEDVEGFLRGLYQRGYFDTAIEYLDYIKTSPVVDAETKASIPFLHARTEYYQGRAMPDGKRDEKETQLNKAIKSYQAFAKANPNHPRAVDGLFEVADVYRTMAQTRMAAASKSKKLVTEARALLKKSEAALKDITGKMQAKLEALRQNPNSVSGDISLVRDRYNATLTRVEYQLAETTLEIASTYKKGSAEHKKQLEAAALLFEDFFDAHGNLIKGLHAIVRAGQCYRDMGNIDFALSCFDSILGDDELAKIPELRPLRYETIGEAMVLWIEQIKGKDNYRQALPIFEDAYRMSELRVRGDDLKKPGPLGVQYYRAQLAATMADKMKRIKLKAVIQQHNALKAEAIEMSGFVAKNEGKYQGKAAALYEQLTGEKPDIPQEKVETFAQAIKASRVAHSNWVPVFNSIRNAPAEQQADLTKRSGELLKEVIDSSQLALSMAKPDTPLEDLIEVYWRMSIAYRYQQSFPEAAVVGEYLARRFPEAVQSRTAAGTALRAWSEMHKAALAAGEDGAFEKARLVSLANYVSEQWDASEEAAEALRQLIDFAVEEKDLDRGVELLARMSQTSRHRAPSQLKLGVRLWPEYQTLSRKARRSKKAVDEKTKQRMATLIEQSETMLSEGINANLEGGNNHPTLTYPALSLAELYVESDRPAEAVSWLEHATIGPLALLSQNAAVLANAALKERVYRTALKGYVKLLATLNGDAFQATKTKVEAMMGGLEDSAKNKAAVAVTYSLLGKDIEADILRRRKAGDDAGADRLTEALELMLARIAGQKDSSYGVLLWVAKTSQNMATLASAKKSAFYYGQASNAYKSILKNHKEFDLNDNTKVGIRMALADCQYGAKQYDDAVKTVKKIFQTHPNSVKSQAIASRSLQAGGKYKEATLGQKDAAVWGWKKLASVVEAKPKYKDLFFEAHLGHLTCLANLGEAGDKNLLDVAKKTLTNFERRFPELGGANWKPRFEKLRGRL